VIAVSWKVHCECPPHSRRKAVSRACCSLRIAAIRLSTHDRTWAGLMRDPESGMAALPRF